MHAKGSKRRSMGWQLVQQLACRFKLGSKLLLSRDAWTIAGVLVLGIPALATCLIMMGLFVHLPNTLAQEVSLIRQRAAAAASRWWWYYWTRKNK